MVNTSIFVADYPPPGVGDGIELKSIQVPYKTMYFSKALSTHINVSPPSRIRQEEEIMHQPTVRVWSAGFTLGL